MEDLRYLCNQHISIVEIKERGEMTGEMIGGMIGGMTGGMIGEMIGGMIGRMKGMTGMMIEMEGEEDQVQAASAITVTNLVIGKQSKQFLVVHEQENEMNIEAEGKDYTIYHILAESYQQS